MVKILSFRVAVSPLVPFAFGDHGLLELCEALLDPFHVVFRPHHFEAIEVGNLAFRGDDVSGEAEVWTKVDIAGGDDPAQVIAVLLLVEEVDDLLGYGPGVLPHHTHAAAVGGHDEHVGFVDQQRLLVAVDRDARVGQPELLYEAVRVVGR